MYAQAGHCTGQTWAAVRLQLGFPCPDPSPEDAEGMHLPELQAFLHDRVGWEEDQEPMGYHAGNVSWKHGGHGQGRGPAGSWERGLVVPVLSEALTPCEGLSKGVGSGGVALTQSLAQG